MTGRPCRRTASSKYGASACGRWAHKKLQEQTIGMIITNVFERTFFIKGRDYGTAFTIEVQGQEFLVTADHLVPPGDGELVIQVHRKGRLEEVAMTVVGRGGAAVDIAVLRPSVPLAVPDFKLSCEHVPTALGHQLFFLGYPYKLLSQSGFLLGGQPTAYVKRATLAMVDTGVCPVMFFDAMNNEGFSGGPVIALAADRPTDPRVMGVVSGFRVETEHVLDVRGNRTGMTVNYNTGIMKAYGISYAQKLIARHLSS